MADPMITSEMIAPFADEIRKAVKAANPLKKDEFIVSDLLKAPVHWLSDPNDALFLLGEGLRNSIAAAAVKSKKPPVEQVAIDTEGYTCRTMTIGHYNDREYEYDPEVGWRDSLTEEQLCTEFEKKVTVFKAGTPVLFVKAEADFYDDVQDESVIQFKLEDLVITVKWLEHPIDHGPVARDLLAILKKAGMPVEVTDQIEDFDYVVEQDISVGSDVRIEIQIPAFHGRKRSAAQTDEPAKKRKK